MANNLKKLISKKYKRSKRATTIWFSKKTNQRRSAYSGLALALLISGALGLHLVQESHSQALELTKEHKTIQTTKAAKKAVETHAKQLEGQKVQLEQKIQTDYVPKAQHDEEIKVLNEKVKSAEQSAAIRHAQVHLAVYRPYSYSSAGNTYTPGQCTWGVKNWRPSIPNGWGNANQWLGHAQAAHWATGSSPHVGAVGTRLNGNHVVLVLGVSGGSVTIREMNYNYIPYSVRVNTVPASSFYYIY